MFTENIIEKEISYRLGFFTALGVIIIIFAILLVLNNNLLNKYQDSSINAFAFFIISFALLMIFIGIRKRSIIFYYDNLVIRTSNKSKILSYENISEIILRKQSKKNLQVLQIFTKDDFSYSFSSNYIGNENLQYIFNLLKSKAYNANIDEIEELF